MEATIMKSKTVGVLYYMIFFTALMAFNIYVLLDTFVIPHSIEHVQTEGDSTAGSGENWQTVQDTSPADDMEETEGIYTDNSYQDKNISINITTERIYDTDIYVADVKLSDAGLLKTALAKDTFGTNVTETTSVQAEAKGAIFAVNGDFYGAHTSGYVIKNGVVYRDSLRDETQNDDLVIYEDGSFGIINEKDISAQQLVDDGVVQLFMFGPALVENGEIVVDADAEVGKAMASNPRTAVGIIDELHYVFIVADGRTDENKGLLLYELAQLMKSYGCVTAYNLDGGGSTTMYFNGRVINKPTTDGHDFKEREVSDIVYVGY